jgi:hypothetical protein
MKTVRKKAENRIARLNEVEIFIFMALGASPAEGRTLAEEPKSNGVDGVAGAGLKIKAIAASPTDTSSASRWRMIEGGRRE